MRLLLILSLLFVSCSKKDPTPEIRCIVGHRMDVSTGSWESSGLGCYTKLQFDNYKPSGNYYTDFTWEKCTSCK